MSPEQRRVRRAHKLIFLSSFQELPLEQCWAEVCPEFDGSPETARELAKAEIEWSRRHHPIPMKALLHLRHMDTGSLIKGLLTQLDAVLPTNVTVKDKGKVVRRYYEDPVPPEAAVPDGRARNDAATQWLTIHEVATPEDASTTLPRPRRSPARGSRLLLDLYGSHGLSRDRAPARPGSRGRRTRGSRHTTTTGARRCSSAAFGTYRTTLRMRSAPSVRADAYSASPRVWSAIAPATGDSSTRHRTMGSSGSYLYL